MTATRVRPAAVAGMFYDDDPERLRAWVDDALAAARATAGAMGEAASPKAIVVPHAGYVYSGQVAASAWARVNPTSVERIVLLGPAHRVPVRGLAVSSADAFATPPR